MAVPIKPTLAAMLEWASERLADCDLHFGQGTDNPTDEAAWLVLHAAGLRPDLPPSDPQQLLTAAQVELARELVERRREERVPAAYLTHRAWFAGLELYVDERVLIPRSPLAEPIMAGFAPWLERDRVTDVLDLCTGSGCIALACARAFPAARVDASDLSADALAVARINVERLGLGERVHLLQSDLFAQIPPRRYQLIISNPPYVGDAEMADLPAEFLHEPDLALRADDEGLALVSRMLFDALDYLDEDGILVVEVGNTAVLVDECYPDLALEWLEFRHGGDGVFLVRAQDLREWVDVQGYD